MIEDVATPEEGNPEDNQEKEVLTEVEKSPLKTASSYEDVYAFLETEMKERKRLEKAAAINDLLVWGAKEESAMAVEDAAPAEMPMEIAESAAMTDDAGGDYSTTNVRQEGVDEADVVKTDGRYLYVLRNDNRKLSIVDTKNGLDTPFC